MATGNDNSQLYEDLKGFLISDRLDIRKAATEAILQIRHDEEHRQCILEHDNGLLLQALIRNTSYDESEHGKDAEAAAAIPVNALQALVYLSSHGTTAASCLDILLDSNMISRALELVLSTPPPASSRPTIQEAWRCKVNYAMALLANLTRLEQGAVDMVGRTLPDQAVTAAQMANEKEGIKVKASMDLLLDRYLNPSFVQKWPEQSEQVDHENTTTAESLESQGSDPYQHFAAVLMNSTQVEQGRRFLLQLHYTTKQEEGTSVFQTILPQLQSENPIRRRGTAGTIRNTCLDRDNSFWLLYVVQISKNILYPLAGPEELDVDEKQGMHPDLWLEGPDKKREVDQQTRLYLVESILLLCHSGRKSRERLRLDRTYVILKWADCVEESEEVSELINECVQYLRRDEEGTEEGSSDALVADGYKRIMAADTASKQIRGDNGKDETDYDAID